MTDPRQRFLQRFGAIPRLFRAPGRVNLIGEHTDYNQGFVMPAAIEFATWVAIAPNQAGRDARRVAVYSADFDQTCVFDLNEATPRARGHWSDYVRGVAVTLERQGHRLRGGNLLVKGEVPIGAGLSSSAAIEVATALGLLANSEISLDLTEVALACQRAENDFVGIRSGIMDQFVSCHGRKDHALMLDCRSLAFHHLPLPPAARLVICNTGVKHELAAGEYNRRRAECEEGARHLGVASLREATLEDLERHRSGMSDVVLRRCRHVISENARVEAAAAALESGDLAGFGRLMNESHRSLRDDYEVSCAELDLMVELASEADGVYGARMTGGGFGGCTINLVETGRVEEFKSAVGPAYLQATGRVPTIYVSSAVDGAGEAPL